MKTTLETYTVAQTCEGFEYDECEDIDLG